MCGTCKWWERWPNHKPADEIALGDCMAAVPSLLPVSVRLKDRVEMYENEGHGCPCYAPSAEGEA